MRLEEWLEEHGTPELQKRYDKYMKNKEHVTDNVQEEIKLLLYNKRHLIENNKLS